jgi:hypothetical protein
MGDLLCIDPVTQCEDVGGCGPKARKMLDAIITSDDDKESLELMKGILELISAGDILNLCLIYNMLEKW